jgi:hypothetical protein
MRTDLSLGLRGSGRDLPECARMSPERSRRRNGADRSTGRGSQHIAWLRNRRRLLLRTA